MSPLDLPLPPSSDLPSSIPSFLSNPHMYLVEHWKEEMVVITGAPIAFSVAILLVGLVLWKAVHLYYKNRLDDLKSRLDLGEERLKFKDAAIADLVREIAKLKEQPLASSPTRQDLYAWPSLTDAQQQTLHHCITQSAVPAQARRVDIVCQNFPDCARLAKTLTTLFRDAAWNVGSSPIVEISLD